MKQHRGQLQFRIAGYGYIYIDEHGRLKWGWSANPQVRLRKSQTTNGDSLRLICLIPGITQADERRLHGELRKYRVAPNDYQRREWYYNRREVWDGLRKFAKGHNTRIAWIEPEQYDLFGDDDAQELAG